MPLMTWQQINHCLLVVNNRHINKEQYKNGTFPYKLTGQRHKALCSGQLPETCRLILCLSCMWCSVQSAKPLLPSNIFCGFFHFTWTCIWWTQNVWLKSPWLLPTSVSQIVFFDFTGILMLSKLYPQIRTIWVIILFYCTPKNKLRGP
jgi:hypothetical protein